jgi:hypothetical protein
MQPGTLSMLLPACPSVTATWVAKKSLLCLLLRQWLLQCVRRVYGALSHAQLPLLLCVHISPAGLAVAADGAGPCSIWALWGGGGGESWLGMCWEPHTLIEMSIFWRYEDYEEDQPTVHGECCTWLVPVTALWHVSVTAPCTGAARGGTAPCLSTLVVVFEQPLLLGCGC